MDYNMKNEIIKLIKFYELEKKIKDIETKLNEAPAILKAMDDKISEKQKEADDKKSELAELNKQYRYFESELKTNEEKAKKKDNSLMSVKNNKEYQAVLKETSELKEKNSALETKILEYLDNIDKKQEELTNFKKELKKTLEDIKSEKIHFLHKQKETEKNLEKLKEEKELRESDLPDDIFKKYRLVKDNLSEKAVAAVKDSICSGCNLNIPAQKYNDLQKFDKLEVCPRCGRIIYYYEI
jgi:uncharacterized protein